MKIIIEIGFQAVFVRYTEEITSGSQPLLHQSLWAALSVLRGVQQVEMRRYDAVVHVAPWVRAEIDVAKDIHENVFDDPNVDGDLTAAYGEHWLVDLFEPDPLDELLGAEEVDVDDDDDDEPWKSR